MDGIDPKCPACLEVFRHPAMANAQVGQGYNVFLILCPSCGVCLGVVADIVQPATHRIPVDCRCVCSKESGG